MSPFSLQDTWSTLSRHHYCVLFLALTMLVLASCHTTGSKRARNNIKLLSSISPGLHWSPIFTEDFQVSWISEETLATIFYSSRCGKKAEIPLKVLVGELLLGMTDRNVIMSSEGDHESGKTLETIVNAKLDNSLRAFKIFALKKKSCLYFVVLASTPEAIKSDMVAYDIVVKSFVKGALLGEK